MTMLYDRVKFTTTSTGTGPFNIEAAVSGFLTPEVAGAASGASMKFYMEDGLGNAEWGVGVLASGTPWTLSVAKIIGSTGSGAAIAWGAGTKTIGCSPTASDFGQSGMAALSDYLSKPIEAAMPQAENTGALL